MEVSFRKKKRTITEYFVHMNGEKFEFYDVYRTITRIDDNRSSIVMTDQTMIKVFLVNGIINSPGSRTNGSSIHGATLGPNGKEFIAILEKKRTEME